MNNTAVYIHIPFCDHKCIYCDFYSIITSDNIDPFLDAVSKEIKYYADLYKADRKISSIFFGGGTPSLMNPEYIAEIIQNVKSGFDVTDNAEITMESNPGTLNAEKLKKFLQSGINRISFGVQSFDNNDLKFLTRIHNAETAISAVWDAKNAGFNNISIDLIFNLPGQTKSKWLQNLETAVRLPITHISTYSLILERGTILNKMVLDGKVEIQDDDQNADLYEMTIDYLTAHGFVQYEVSNFAKPGFECIHNNAYWRYKDYFGFGPSAHSFIGGKRSWNYSSLKKYISEIGQKGQAVCSSEYPDNKQKLDEYIMLTLRSSGIDLNELSKSFNSDWLSRNDDYLKMLENNNFLTRVDDLIKLTPSGYAVCDEILGNLD
jgi:oxygen-independent coproporphyrinogen III oxidase